jgi:hypothetical protein
MSVLRLKIKLLKLTFSIHRWKLRWKLIFNYQSWKLFMRNLSKNNLERWIQNYNLQTLNQCSCYIRFRWRMNKYPRVVSKWNICRDARMEKLFFHKWIILNNHTISSDVVCRPFHTQYTLLNSSSQLIFIPFDDGDYYL